MDKLKFNNFIKAICKYYAEKTILVGSDIFSDIIAFDKENKSNFTFIECNFLGNRIIVFSDRHPLSNKAILIDDILAFDKYIDEIKSPMMAIPNASDANYITIHPNEGGRKIMLLLENDKIKQQELIYLAYNDEQ